MSKGSGLGAIEKPYHGPIQSGKSANIRDMNYMQDILK